MLKVVLFVLFISQLAFSAGTSYINQLKDFHQGLEERHLLLRHQVKRAIVQAENAKNAQEKRNAFIKNKSFFKYLLSSVEEMNVNSSSKAYIKKGLTGLIKAESQKTSSRQVSKELRRPRNEELVLIVQADGKTRTEKAVSHTRQQKFKNAIKVRNKLPVKRKIDRISTTDLTGIAGWAYSHYF